MISDAFSHSRPVTAAIASLFVMTVAAHGADWSNYQHDPQHTGRSNASISSLSAAWTAPGSYATPLIVGDTVYGTLNAYGVPVPSTYSAFDLTTGATKWSFTGNYLFPSQAGVGAGLVVFQASDQAGEHPGAVYVLDAATGVLRYTVPLVNSSDDYLMPLIIQDQATGTVTAYCPDGSTLRAIQLGSTSGTILWSATGSFGGSSIPTVVEDSLIVAGPGQYYAIDRQTGVVNHFHAGAISGGGGSTVAYDSSRRQFYVLEDYNDPTATLSAYHYTDHDHISLLWQRTGAGVGGGGSAAIGLTGNVYSSGNSVVWEMDPTTGATLRSISGSFANGMTPAISNGLIWTFSESNTVAYDLNTLGAVINLTGSRGSSNSAYDSPGAICDNHFILDYGHNHGFVVFAGPGPVHLAGVVSRMTHGDAGSFDVNLPLTGNPGIECRSGGDSGDFTLVFTFTNSLTSVGNATVSQGTGSVQRVSLDQSDAHNCIVHLTGVTNAQNVTVTLSSVRDNQGGNSNAIAATVGVLLGDTNADGVANIGDTMQTRAQSGSNITAANFREDVTVDGYINIGDAIVVRAQSGTNLPVQAAPARPVGTSPLQKHIER